MIKAGYYARVDYAILKEFLSIQRPLNQHVTGNYKRVLSFVPRPKHFVTRNLLYYSYRFFVVSDQRSKMELFLFFFFIDWNIFRCLLLLYASTVLVI